ncbi:uncharacterized protein J3D65DRAFT_531964, partial [Phyllosticta citribraziliensis]
KSAVNAFNEMLMRRCNQPVITIHATQRARDPLAASASFDQAGRLNRKLPSCIGARDMVLQNIWVYSSLGSVQDIRWADDTVDLFNTMPSVVLVALDKYNVDGYNPGDYDLSFFDLDPEGKPVVPIFPAVHTFMFGGARCSRTQFPLTTANTITIHKTWSISVDLVVVNFDHRGSTPVLSYVAVLRVRSLQGLIVEEPIDY